MNRSTNVGQSGLPEVGGCGVCGSELRQAVRAARAVGWYGAVRGPVVFGGVQFYPVLLGPVLTGPPGSGWLAGCVVVCTDPYVGMQEASWLAGYSRRLIAIHTPSTPSTPSTRGAAAAGTDAGAGLDLVDVQLQAAVLDQGVVVQHCTAGGSDLAGSGVLSWPGEIVASPLQHDDKWRSDCRWQAFCAAISFAPRDPDDYRDAGDHVDHVDQLETGGEGLR